MDKFCDSLFRYERRRCHTVTVGDVKIGSSYGVVPQSMCTTDTLDTEASARQAAAIADAGGKLVRYTAQGRSQAQNLKAIKERLAEMGYNVPLVADIHFNPAAADIAATVVEKVRINPGNFVDKRATLENVEFTPQEYEDDKRRLDERFTAFLAICREHGTAVRIGVNHGSLSDRIMSEYGDTPQGMTESAMELLRICKRERFDDVVVSMKSSNTQVMVRAYRMIATAMRAEGMDYPLHLGVTEAGEGEDGRIKSAVGMGALMADGLGDTIRVSLTEAPEAEIPVANALISIFEGREKHAPIPEQATDSYSPYEYKRRNSRRIGEIGDGQPPVVPDSLPEGTRELSIWKLDAETLEKLRREPCVVAAVSDNINATAELRAFFLRLDNAGIDCPVIIVRRYPAMSEEDFALRAAAECGQLFIDGYGDGLMLECEGLSKEVCEKTAYAILQAARVRFTKTEYISCPGCGRTLFNLTETLRRVKAATSELKGLKIAVMGCIVNGPGEMADADYGYVGAGPGKVTLYKGREAVKRAIPEERAIDELLDLLKQNNELPQ